MSILDQIIEYKRVEVQHARTERSAAALDRDARTAAPPRGFAAALDTAATTGFGLIAEIKKASPSRGLIRADFAPAQLAEDYAEGGAACLSVLTDGPAFKGSLSDLVIARAASPLPVLRKDFMIDPYQVIEARAHGADAILLILAVLSDAQAGELHAAATDYGLDVLVETHNAAELERALRLPAAVIGVNNRNLHNFHTDLQTSIDLAAQAGGRPIVAESGISGHTDLVRLSAHGIRRFLVGETLMRAPNVRDATRALLGQ